MNEKTCGTNMIEQLLEIFGNFSFTLLICKVHGISLASKVSWHYPSRLLFVGLLKKKVYLQRPFQDIDHLERIIKETCETVIPDVIRNVIKEFNKRTITCMGKDVGYIEIP